MYAIIKGLLQFGDNSFCFLPQSRCYNSLDMPPAERIIMEQVQENYYTVEDYFAVPDGIRTELIDGEFFDMAPPTTNHQKLLGEIYTSIHHYIKEKGGKCAVMPAPFGVQLNENDDTVVEPDISVICDPNKLTTRGCVGAPDWIIEIVSPGNPGHDYIRKLNLYAKAGVREYWIVDPITYMVTVYYPEEGNLTPVEYTFEDKVKPKIYDDLIIDFMEMKKGLIEDK